MIGEKWELFEAIYGPEGFECTELDDRGQYARLATLIEENKTTIYSYGFILAIARQFQNRPVACCILTGEDDTLKHFDKLQTDLETANGLLRSIGFRDGYIAEYNKMKKDTKDAGLLSEEEFIKWRSKSGKKGGE